MKFTTNCLSFLLLTTLLLSESTNGLINSHTLIANTANIKRVVAAVVLIIMGINYKLLLAHQ